jgi:hypothetical protein
VSELLAWRINRHLAIHADDTYGTAPAAGKTGTGPLLPWVPGLHRALAASGATPLAAYLTDAAALITRRTETLADTAIRLRPPWVNALGYPPASPERAADWRRHAAVVAAYRDQHGVTSDDPRQVLGPYAEPGRAGHEAYWLAADSVLAARQLAGIDDASAVSAENRARAQVAADLYRALPDTEQAAVARLVTTDSANRWLSNPVPLDEEAAIQAPYAASLITELARRRYLTTGRDERPRPHPSIGPEPYEAGLARRRQTERSVNRQRGNTAPETQAGQRDKPLYHTGPRQPAPGNTPVITT